MTLRQLLETKGFEVTKTLETKFGIEYGCDGLTPDGKEFRLENCAGAWGQYSLFIEGMNRTAHCKLATAIQKIRNN